MEDSDSKRNDSPSFARNEETRLFKELQALMSCSVPTDLLMSILQSQMLCHSNNDIHKSISHLLISYSGKRGSIANITILPLDIAQIIRYLFGVSIAIVNCTQYTTLKDLVTKLTVHTNVNYKEWTQQLKNKMITNSLKNTDNTNDNTNESDDKKSLNSPNNKPENKDTDDEITSQILILSDTPSNSNTNRSNNNINIISPQIPHDHEESHSSLYTERLLVNSSGNTQIKRYLTEPTLTKTSRTSSPSATPPPDEKENKENKTDIDNKQPPFGYGIKEEQVVTTKYHNNHFHKHANREREHLSQSIHSLHKLQHSQSNASDEYVRNVNVKTGMDTNINKNSKYKMDCISCQVIIFHNIHKLTKAMQSIVVQIMKMKSIPSHEHSTHIKSAPNTQLCVLTRQCNKTIPYLLRDLCLIDYVINSKKCLRKLHRFVGYDLIEHKQSYYSHVSGISFDGSGLDNKFKISQLSQYDNNLNVSYNMLSSQSPSNNINMNATTPMKLEKNNKDNDTSNNSDINHNNIGLFPLTRLKILYSLVKGVFIHNSIAQYIRDIIIAIRLHPDVKQGCSSFRANEALNISSKFTNFMSRLGDRYKRLRNSQKYIDQLIARVHFVRPKDVDCIAIQILAHRIDMIATDIYTPAVSEHIHGGLQSINKKIIKQNVNVNVNNAKNKVQYLKMKTMPFSQIQPMKSFPIQREHSAHSDEREHREHSESDDELAQKGNNRIRRDFSIKARAEILKQLRLDTKSGVRRRGGGYRTGSMSLPRTPRGRRSVSLSHSQIHDDISKLYHRKDIKKSHMKLLLEYKQNKKSIDSIDEINIDNFEFELFEDSDDYGYIDDEYQIDYDYDGYDMDGDDIDGHNDDNDGHGGSGRQGYDDDINDTEYIDEYDECFIDDNIDSNNDTNQSSKRNSNRGHNNGDNYTQYSLLNETNEKKLSVQQRLVYNLLRRVLLPPK
eukprot:166642_1